MDESVGRSAATQAESFALKGRIVLLGVAEGLGTVYYPGYYHYLGICSARYYSRRTGKMSEPHDGTNSAAGAAGSGTGIMADAAAGAAPAVTPEQEEIVRAAKRAITDMFSNQLSSEKKVGERVCRADALRVVSILAPTQ